MFSGAGCTILQHSRVIDLRQRDRRVPSRATRRPSRAGASIEDEQRGGDSGMLARMQRAAPRGSHEGPRDAREHPRRTAGAGVGHGSGPLLFAEIARAF